VYLEIRILNHLIQDSKS